jgi:hypothetical protein
VSDDVVYADVVLRGPADWQRVVNAIRPNAGPAVERGKPLHVIVVSSEADATDEQRAFYFSHVLKRIADEVPEEDGDLRPVTYWHEKLALEFLGMVETTSQRTGRIHRRRRSVARGEITVGEMARYITTLQAWAANTHGVEWDF